MRDNVKCFLETNIKFITGVLLALFMGICSKCVEHKPSFIVITLLTSLICITLVYWFSNSSKR
jgi:F0F1-type ATP synthase assembly protein I